MKTCMLILIPVALAMATSALAELSGPETLPSMFVENLGQWDTSTRFLASRGNVVTRIEQGALALDLPRGPETAAGRVSLHFVFEGAAPEAAVVGEDRSRAVTNFLIGNDPARWRRGAPSYRRVLYPDLYPGVDVRVREDAGRLKYDVLVAPGADLAPVVIRCEGATALCLAADGSLEMETPAGTLRQTVPATWQELPSGGRITVECKYRILSGNRYGFAVPGRDPGLPLVIDPRVEVPGLEWSTFFGTLGTDLGTAIAFGDNGRLIVAGQSDYVGIPGIPTTPGAYDPTFNGVCDAWVACFDPAQSGDEQRVWCTYLGGGQEDRAFDIALDAGSVWVVGITSSTDFPTTPDAYDRTYNGGGSYPGDVFVTQLSGDGASLLYSTFLGGSASDWAVEVDVAAPWGITVSGYTRSSGFPTTPGAFDRSYNGSIDAFVTRFDRVAPSSLVFSTFLGGSATEGSSDYVEMVLGGLAVDGSGAATVAGGTGSTNFPTTQGAYQRVINGTRDAFLTRLSPLGDSLRFSTYFGGSDVDGAATLAIMPSGNLALGGYTYSTDLPTTPGAFDTSFNGGLDDGFIAIVGSAGDALLYSTYLGGGEVDAVTLLAVDSRGDVVGSSFCNLCPGFPVTPDAYDPNPHGLQDAFVFRLRPTGLGAHDLLYGTFLGGADMDAVWALALAPGATMYDPVALTGSTRSYEFPTTPSAFDSTHNSPGLPDGWVALFGAIGWADVEEPPVVGTTPASLHLGAPHPNPSQGPVAFTIDLPARSRVHVGIYDVGGRLVTELLDREVTAGHHKLTWDPLALRQHVSPGIYFIRLEAGGVTDSRKAVIRP